MLSFLIRYSQNSEEAKEQLAKHFALITSVIVRCVNTSDSWQKKKTSKTGQVVNLFTKAAKVLHKSSHAQAVVPEQGAKLVTALETLTENDKAMANLKGKIKEIKAIVASI